MTEGRKGFEVLVGGKFGEDTRLAQPIAWFLSEDEAFELAKKALVILKDKQINAVSIIDEIGIKNFKQLLELGA
jgi:sulfite reductase beta subunit-like hemoprotein